ncbi:MAG: methylhydantoinase [Rhodospirillaceae bacterium]|nr:methylhydantoinase [Rhodospirillaceae bacterium]
MWSIGVDVGGTFTDFHAVNSQTGRVFLHKTPSTPDDPSRAILGGLNSLLELAGIEVGDIVRLAHGTTVATNALIQRKGSDVAVITTEGFKDLLEIGRQIRPKMYSLKEDFPPPLAPRHMRFEVNERVGSKGQVIKPLTREAIERVVRLVSESNPESCAICFLFSFLRPEHEESVGAELKKHLPDIHVSISAQVQPEFREYERFSTTLLNAYLQPLIGKYMKSLGCKFTEMAPKARLGINQSSGGLMSVERASSMPIRTALSGPAAGTVGAIYQAKLAGTPNIITLDMGGTSADVALIQEYETGISYNRTVAGFPIRLPMVDIHTVGAGGGSIAWFDRDGLMKVGPTSAGADPGPACYDQGGREPTVSDANLILGRLPTRLIGGAMRLSLDRAREAIRPMADRLGFSIERTAHGIIGIVVANMVRAIRTISVERGHDPRDFTLMPFGGAGALHAVDVARALDMREILIPPAPGILCAQGLVVSELKEDFVITRRLPYDDGLMISIQEDLEDLCMRANNWFELEDIGQKDRLIRIAFDMRYVRQNFELTVPWIDITGDKINLQDVSLDELRDRFYHLHERTYGHFTEYDPIEIVNIRSTAVGKTKENQEVTENPESVSEPISRVSREVWFNAERAETTPVYQRSELYSGQFFNGPTIIEQLDAMTIIYPGDLGKIDIYGNLIIEVNYDSKDT